MKMNKYLHEGAIKAENVAEIIAEHNGRQEMGGHCIFLGQVRNDKVDDKVVAGIEYSAYEEMVAEQMDAIEKEIYSIYPDVKNIYIKHSTGLVRSGEISLFVFIGSGHRKEAFEALPKTVDLIKANVPFWKKELFTDGSFRWVEE